jgi:excisionase family DNA binding protein
MRHATTNDAPKNGGNGAVMYSLAEAAKATRKSKSTLTRAIKKGTIAATKNGNGQYEIDPSELHRVYPPVASGGVAQQPNDAPRNSDEAPDLLNELIELRAQAKATGELVSAHESTIADLRDRLDQEGAERRQLTAILTDQRTQPSEAAPVPRKGFFARVFG